VDAAAQVEPEVHRQRVDHREPVWRGREQVERDRIRGVLAIRVQRVVERVLRLEIDRTPVSRT
jgi:hypothetical protein